MMKNALFGAGVLAATLGLAGAAAGESVYVFEFEDWNPTEGWSQGGPTANPNTLLNLGDGAEIYRVAWDITVTAEGSSWLADWRVGMVPTTGAFDSGLFLTPGAGQNTTGTMNFADDIVLADVQIPNIVLTNGELYIESYSAFTSGTFIGASGSITLYYIPAPGALALFGMAGLVGPRRRRA